MWKNILIYEVNLKKETDNYTCALYELIVKVCMPCILYNIWHMGHMYTNKHGKKNIQKILVIILRGAMKYMEWELVFFKDFCSNNTRGNIYYVEF